MIMLEEYRGKGALAHVLETQAANRVSIKVLKREAGLYQRKWYDYRLLHHGEATLLFHAWYEEMRKLYHRKYFDKDEAEVLRPRYPLLFSNTRKSGIVGQFYACRQKADKWGIPYGFYISACMDYMLKDWSRPEVPKIENINKEGMDEIALEGWDMMHKGRLFVAENDFFRAKNYVGHPDQIAHNQWLERECMRRQSPQYAIGQVVFDNPTIPLDIATEMFGQRLIDKAV
jgi:hypothetical protein